MTTTVDLSDPIDRRALQAAMTRCRADKEWTAAIAAKLEDEAWEEVAAFAAYVCQCRALNLRPWQEPPSVACEDDPADRDPDARRLLRRMLKTGVSRYDPDPLAALAKAKAG
jgi:hypothetical protein